jgi:hypothetical protein
MPIEREFKYVMQNSGALEHELLTRPVELGLVKIVNIQQGYLSRGGRVRRLTEFAEFQTKLLKLSTEFVFTYKHDLSQQPGSCLEIETNISDEDFILAWEDSDHQIEKTRYVVLCNDDRRWEIDFFKRDGETYFVMAECEVPATEGAPETLHPFVEEHLVLAVDSADGRFKNRQLCNPDKVAVLLRDIQDGKAKA